MALRSLRGHPVLLNFFNSQCPDCLDELPTLRHTARTYQAQGVIVLGVATGGDTIASARALALAGHLPYPVVADEHQDVAWHYNVGGWPISFFLDAQGHGAASTLGRWTHRPCATDWLKREPCTVRGAAVSTNLHLAIAGLPGQARR